MFDVNPSLHKIIDIQDGGSIHYISIPFMTSLNSYLINVPTKDNFLEHSTFLHL